MIDFGMQTATGTRHKVNEDSLGHKARLWLVADGMGGHAAGNVASQIVRDTLLAKSHPGIPLAKTVRAAHDAVMKAAQDNKHNKGMGSTVAAVRVAGDEAEVTWVGDSRVYLLREGELSRVTTDHSYVQYLLARGDITAEEAETHPERNVLIRTLGFEEPEADVVSVELEPGDQLLIATDGVTTVVSDDHIARLLLDAGTPQAAADALINAVIEQKGNDDASAIVLRYKERSAAVPVILGVTAGVLAFLLLMWMKSS